MNHILNLSLGTRPVTWALSETQGHRFLEEAVELEDFPDLCLCLSYCCFETGARYAA